MNPTPEWYMRQSEYNRHFYEWLHAHRSDLLDWKVTALFYSALHRVNYWFITRTGRVPKNHLVRNRRVENELPQVFNVYRDLYFMSLRARYRDGYRTDDHYRRLALDLLNQIEREIPFQ